MLASASEDELLDRAWARLGASTQQAHNDMVALLALPGEVSPAEETELYYLAALILRSQDRLDDVLTSNNPRLHKCELIWTALEPHLRRHGCNLRIRSRYAVGGTGHDSIHDEDAPSEDMDPPMRIPSV
ncbi:hypothetical protein EXIGLDRAFT_776677 [Exidia glandulosa HHB12029]|uniref:Uncharacterized protein n=1 Tax=Exidia glandulosa HHB12029 TaxID=1314781 RepID=A0A165DEA1_EXIGL|nr:hypothetical protein EXIGLDRAFT_776677 [Exidia glandulosa HHB12029]